MTRYILVFLMMLVIAERGGAASLKVPETSVTPQNQTVFDRPIHLPRIQRIVTERSPFSLREPVALRKRQTADCLSHLAKSERGSSGISRVALRGIVQENGEHKAIVKLATQQLRWVSAGDRLLQGRTIIHTVTAKGIEVFERTNDGRCYRSWLSLSEERRNEQ
ncbi:hypothetical protein ACFODT_07485 [Vibrio zhugei]|uniref:Pilus assembly protein PilP n=1 Tax=Vibrio zhugei TaxID=2479546 RepID=A0ABV7CAA4_9VIBR|nr:hypothetical protein [Vibrio zhugei]